MTVLRVDNFAKGMNNYIGKSVLPVDIASNIVNAECSTGNLVPIKGTAYTGFDDPIKLDWHGTKDRSVAKWFNEYYWSDNVKLEYGGTKALGITPPSSLLTITPVTGELEGNYKYCYTYVMDGWESAPFTEGATIWYTSIKLSKQTGSFTLPSSYPKTITHIRVYRTIAEDFTFYLIGEYDKTNEGKTITDTISDLDLGLHPVIDSLNNFPPPQKGKFLTENEGVFYLAIDNKLYMSQISNPHAWNRGNWVGVKDTITGIASTYQGILIFTNNSTTKLLGNTIATLFVQNVPDTMGCPNWRTISKISNFPIWVSNDGICLFDGQNILLVSYQKITMPKQIICGETANDVYYLFHDTGVVCFDYRNNQSFRLLDIKCDYCWYDGIRNKFYLQLYNNEIHEFGAGENLTVYYESGWLSESELTYKNFRKLKVYSEGEVRIIFDVEDETIMDKYIKGNGWKQLFLPVSTGRYCVLKLQSNHLITEFMLDFEQQMQN